MDAKWSLRLGVFDDGGIRAQFVFTIQGYMLSFYYEDAVVSTWVKERYALL